MGRAAPHQGCCLRCPSTLRISRWTGHGCGLEVLQAVIDAARLLQTLMQDARGVLIR